MTRGDVLTGIQEVAREHLGWKEEIREEMHMVKTFRLDSLRLLTLVMEVENRFSICLAEGSESEIETVGDLADLIEETLRRADPE